MKVGDLVSSKAASTLKASGLVLELGNRYRVEGEWHYAHAQVAWVDGDTAWEPHYQLEVVHASG